MFSALRVRNAAVTATAAAAVLGLTLAGCGGGSEGGGDGGGEALTVGLSVSTLNNPFFVTLRDGAQQAADEAGAELVISDAQNDAASQQSALQNFLTQQVDAIAINPVDSDAAAAAVRPANQEDVPVIAVDRAVNGAEVASTVASDNVEGGRLAAETLADAVGEGEVVVLQGIPGTSASRDRGQGFSERIADSPEVEVVAEQPADFDRAEALDVMTNLLQAHPDIEGVFAENDEMALGAIQALGDRAGDDVVVVGFDGTPDGLDAVQNGTMHASVAQQPAELGSTAVEVALQAARGEAVEQTIQVPVKVVTQDNVEEFVDS